MRRLLRYIGVVPILVHAAPAGALTCDLSGYRQQPGLVASAIAGKLNILWQGSVRGSQVRAVLATRGGVPAITLAARAAGQKWVTIAEGATPEFRVISGLRRITSQQIAPLKALGIPITQAIIDKQKWEAFWDSPLLLGAEVYGPGPPKDGIGNQPALPRQPIEIIRSTASYNVSSCTVKTNGARLEISLSGVELAPFSGSLRYTFYKGTNLIRQEVIAKTDRPSVAYKYDAGLSHFALTDATQAVWRDMTGAELNYKFGGGINAEPVPVQTKGRLLALQRQGGVAFFHRLTISSGRGR